MVHFGGLCLTQMPGDVRTTRGAKRDPARTAARLNSTAGSCTYDTGHNAILLVLLRAETRTYSYIGGSQDDTRVYNTQGNASPRVSFRADFLENHGGAGVY